MKRRPLIEQDFKSRYGLEAKISQFDQPIRESGRVRCKTIYESPSGTEYVQNEYLANGRTERCSIMCDGWTRPVVFDTCIEAEHWLIGQMVEEEEQISGQPK